MAIIKIIPFALAMFIAHTCRETKAANMERLHNTPTQVQAGNLQIEADAYLWRDFMPMSPKDGKPLRSSVTLTAKDSSTMSNEIVLLRQIVVSDAEKWEADIDKTEYQNYSVKGFSQGGPKWTPGTRVNVVVEFKYKEDTYRVRAPDQKIVKTQ